MMVLLTERLTAQFYEWEILGRGWLLGESPVELEPQFTPFLGHFLQEHPVIDDGLHRTILSRLGSLFSKNPETTSKSSQTISYAPYLFDDETDIITLRLIIPKKVGYGKAEGEEFLIMLSYCTIPVGFEVIATSEKIFVQFSCRENFSTYLKSQLQTYFPEVTVIEKRFFLEEVLLEESATAVVDFGIKDEFMRPLAQNGSGPDSLTGIFSILEHLQEGERVIFQVVFNGVVNPWERSILKSVTNGMNKPFFENAPEMLPMAKEKISSPLLTTTIRILAQASSLKEASSLLDKLSFALIIASRSSGNSLIPLSDTQYSFDRRVQDILFCESHRLGMLLNVKELANFVHIPFVNSKKLFGINRKTKSAPKITEGHSMVLGSNEHNGISKAVTISSQQRLKHTHIIGATGTGKSTLLLNMILQDMKAGNGLAVLDPHGDLIENILHKIPKERINDVVIFDPSDSEYPIAFNILHAHSELEKEILSSDLVSAFRRLSTSWGDQMNSVLANAILAFLDGIGGTLIDLRRFLIEKEYRSSFLKNVRDPNIQYYWQKEYPLLKTSSIGPILTRLDSFLRPRIIRNMVAQHIGLDFEEILNKKKILLVKLSQGLIGVENSYMLGTFVVSKIHQAAFARQATEVRNDFFLYVDEFQHFITPSMSSILSGARKYHVGLILAHQDMQQLQKYDAELANSILSNTGTRICFRIGDTDAKKLAEGFSFFDAPDLQNLETGEAIARVEKSENDFSLTIDPIQLGDVPNEKVEKIIAISRERYCTPKHLVEAELFKNLVVPVSEEEKNSKQKHVVFSQKVEEIHQSKEVTHISQEHTNQTETNGSKGIKNIEIIQPVDSDGKTDAVDLPAEDYNIIERIVQKKQETQHRYLQNLIKKMAEARGYKASIEATIPGAKEKVDVLLERGDETIACEISVTTNTEWEIHNIQKCLQAGYSFIVSCMTDKKYITQLQKKLPEVFTPAEMHKIRVMEPEVFINYLNESVLASMETERVVKGYRVKVSYDSLTEEEMKRKKDAVAKVVVDALRKIKH